MTTINNLPNILRSSKNGNVFVTLYTDGTRIIDYEGDNPSSICLDYPLNVDVKISNRCSFGLNPNTGNAVCNFCHESARTDGSLGDLKRLTEILNRLPKTTEIAVGINDVTPEVVSWLRVMKNSGYVVNGTLNQGLIRKGAHKTIITESLLYGIGISFRKSSWGLDDPVYLHDNTVLHVIAGIDDFSEISTIVDQKKIKKILVLGEKDFGFNLNRVDLNSTSHRTWYNNIHTLFDKILISFDNLAIAQLEINRYFKQSSWNTFFQGERSIYIDAVKGVFSPSSRSDITHDWNTYLLVN
jgi:hypothetical protein